MLLAAIEADLRRLRGDPSGAAKLSAIAVDLAEQSLPHVYVEPYVSRAKLHESVGDFASAVQDRKAALEVVGPVGAAC